MIATFSLISYLSTAQVFRDYAMLAEIKKVNYARIAGRGTETGLCAADYDETTWANICLPHFAVVITLRCIHSAMSPSTHLFEGNLRHLAVPPFRLQCPNLPG